MNTLPGKINQTEAKEALKRSGYLLESRLDALLRRQDYYVDANPAYPDVSTGKSRELDLFGINAYQVGPFDLDYIFAILIIECINNPQPIAFITKDPLISFMHTDAVKHAGLPVKIPNKTMPREWVSLPDYLELDKYHHYCKGRIATQFCSFVKKKNSNEWMASHEDAHFDSFHKLSEAVEHYVDKQFKNWIYGRVEPINVEFYYPIVVVQGELFMMDPRIRTQKLGKIRW